MASEQPQTDCAASSETELAQDHLCQPQGWMTVSTFEILELSKEEMERVVGARSYSKIQVD